MRADDFLDSPTQTSADAFLDAPMSADAFLDGPPVDPAKAAALDKSFVGNVVKPTAREIWEGVKATPETAATFATGLAAMPVSGLAGLAKLVASDDLNEAGKTMENVSRALTYQPQGQTSQDTLALIDNAIKYAPHKASDLAYELTGNPDLAAAVATTVELGEFALAHKAGGYVVGPKAPAEARLAPGTQIDPQVFQEMVGEKVRSRIQDTKAGTKESGFNQHIKTEDTLARELRREPIRHGAEKIADRTVIYKGEKPAVVDELRAKLAAEEIKPPEARPLNTQQIEIIRKGGAAEKPIPENLDAPKYPPKPYPKVEPKPQLTPQERLQMLRRGDVGLKPEEKLKAKLAEPKAEKPVTKTEAIPIKPAENVTAKEPWEMSRDEFDAYWVHETRKGIAKEVESKISGAKTEIERLSGEVNQNAGNPANAQKNAEIKKLSEFITSQEKRITASVSKPSSFMSEAQYRHHQGIDKALSEGKPVPSEVLKDYPDLAKPKPSKIKDLESRVTNGHDTNGNGFLTDKAQPKKLPELVTNERGSVTLTGIGVKDAIRDKKTSLREYIEDDWVRVKKLTQREGVKVTDRNNPYDAEIRFHGRVGTRMEEAQKIVERIDKGVLKAAKETGVSDAQIYTDANRYMIARHAPERNAIHGDGAAGMTNAEAAKAMQQAKSSPHFAKIKETADAITDLHNNTLDTLLDAQVISRELHTKLRKQYKNHVPLQRVMDGDDIVDVLSGEGFDVKGTGLMRAKGSAREVADILTNVTVNYKAALARAEKNIVDLRTLQFARENKYFDGLFEEVKPKIIGNTSKKTGSMPIYQEIKDPNVLTMRENGKPVHLKINDPHMATALKGINRKHLDGFLQYVGGFTRLYSKLMTWFDPEFAPPNKIRDLQEAAVYAASKKELGFKGAAKAVAKDPASVKAVTESMLGKDTPGSRLYEQMRQDGGTTGGMALSTRSKAELDIAAIKKLNRSKPRQAARKIIEAVDAWNTIFEDSTRLSVYRQAIESGVSREKAAVLAKEASINFNKMGTGGPVVNGLYMFSNASIQGSAKMLRAMRNPKVAGVVIATTGAAIYAANEFNDFMDPDWRNKVTKWDRLNGINIVVSKPGEAFDWVTVPVGWGIKPIKVGWDKAYDAATGEGEGAASIANDVAVAILEGYNPAGGTDILSAATPTILDTPVDIARNKKWSGAKIRPEYDPNAPDSIKYFDNLRDTPIGGKMVDVTREMGEKGIEISPADMYYAYRQYIGGAGRFIDKSVTTAESIIKGEKPAAREIPFASRFYRSTPEEELTEKSKNIDPLKDRLAKQSKARFYDNQGKRDLLKKLEDMPRKDAAKEFEAVAATDKKKAKDIVRLKEKSNLSYEGSLIKQLGVENGERAAAIVEILNGLPDNKTKSKYFDDMVKNKIMTKEVYRQVMRLFNQKGN